MCMSVAPKSRDAFASRAEEPTGGLSEEQLRDLAELASDWIWEQDADLRFVKLSSEYHRRDGTSTQAALGKRRWELPLAGVTDEAWRAHRAQLERRETFRDFEFARADDRTGELRWYAVSGRPLFDAGGRFTGYRGVGREITAHKRLEQQLRESEAQLRLVTDNIPVGINYLGTDLVPRFHNPAFERIFSHRPGAYGDRPLPEGVGREQFERIKHHVARAMAGETVAYTREEPGPASGPRIVEVRLVPDFGPDNRVRGCYVLVLDVTDLDRAEDRIRHLEHGVRLAMENTSDMMAIYRATPRGMIIEDFNPAITRFYEERFPGVRIADWIGRPIEDFLRVVGGLTPSRVEERMAKFRRAEREGRPLRYRSRIESPSGVQHRDALIVPFARDGGPVTHLFYRGTDITEAVRRSEELERKVEARTRELQAANEELESFAYSVSHDLRTPLRGIDGFAQILAESKSAVLGEDGLGHLARIRRGIQRMGGLIDDLLSLSQVTRSPLERTRVDLSALATEVAADLTRQAIGRRVDWIVAPGIVVDADAGLMRLMLENLLGNAWKYTRDVAAARIEFDAAPVEGGIEISVRDNGAGFDMNHATRMFQPFQRLHDPRRFEGTGIGLATVARIVARHGGRVRAEGVPERGATFHIFLPVDGERT
jgi:PAS domain S-box-containing protein